MNILFLKLQSKIETPVDPSQRLCKATDKCVMYEKEQYQSAVGSLLYLSVKNKA